MPEEDPPLYPKEAFGREKLSSEKFLSLTYDGYRKDTGKGLSELVKCRIGTIYGYMEKMDPKPLPCRTLTQLVRNEKSFRIKETSEIKKTDEYLIATKREGNDIREKTRKQFIRRFFKKGLEKNTTHKAVKTCLNACEIAGTVRKVNFDGEDVYILSYQPIKLPSDEKKIQCFQKDVERIEIEGLKLLESIHKLKERLSSFP